MWGRATAGALPGFFAAAALVGLVCWLLPGSWHRTLVPGLVAFFPVWVAVICTGFRFATGKRAWLWLSLLAAVGMGVLWSLQSTGWVR